MAEIPADYLGGYPGATAVPAEGRLRAKQGAIVFDGSRLEQSLSGTPARVELPPGSVHAITVRGGDEVRRLADGAVGYMLFGSIGGLIAMAGSRTAVLGMQCTVDGAERLVTFGVSPGDGQWLIERIQEGRASRGEAPLPPVAAMVADPVQQELAAIRELLARQNELLGRISDRLERPPV